MSKYLGSVCCLHHRDSSPSMAIYHEYNSWSSGYSYYCFGCHASGFLDEDEAMDLLDTKPKQRDSRILDKAQLTLLRDPGIVFLDKRNIAIKWARDYGIESYESDKLYLPCYNYARKNIGAQTRSLDDNASPKIWSIPDESGKYPTHSWIYGYNGIYKQNMRDQTFSFLAKTVCIVESILDGLSIWSRVGIPSIAVLGTNPTREFYQTLTNLDKKYHHLYIMFDPDNAGITSSLKLIAQLSAYGYSASIPLLEDKVYKIETKELKEVLC